MHMYNIVERLRTWFTLLRSHRQWLILHSLDGKAEPRPKLMQEFEAEAETEIETWTENGTETESESIFESGTETEAGVETGLLYIQQMKLEDN